MIAPHRIDAQSIVELLQWRAATHPEKIAYYFLLDDGDRQIACTYRELDRKARAVAAAVQASGGEGERVLVLYPPGSSYITAFFGCLYAGAVAVPAYPPHQSRNILRLQKIVADAQPALALAPLQTRQALEAICREVRVSEIGLLDVDLVEASEGNMWKQPDVGESAAAFLQYTSGSTGAPRGVVLTHGNLLHNSTLIEGVFDYDEEAHCVSWLPPYHDMGLIGGILQPLFGGYSCTLMPPVYLLQDPIRWLREISCHQNVISGGPDFAYRFCTDKISPEQRLDLDLRTWRVAFTGAEPVRHDTLQRFAEAFGPCGFRPKAFLPCYGLAEATLLVSGTRNHKSPVMKTVHADQLEKHSWVECSWSAANARHLISSGGIPGQRVEIVDPHSLTLCGADQIGEIWIHGPSVAAGYWRREEETAQTFHAYLRDTGEGPFLRTGDLGVVRDQELFITGRIKDLIIIHGRNLYPQDIESTVQISHPTLRSTIGAAFSIEKDGEERLVVVQEIDRHTRKGLDEILEDIRLKIQAVHEVSPFAVLLIKKGTIPRTSSGKIQRHACRAAFQANSLSAIREWREGTPPVVVSTNLTDGTDSSATEEWFRHTLAEVLHVDARHIDIGRKIIDYGMDSIQAIEFLHRIEVKTGKSLSIARLLQGPTITDIVSLLAQESTEHVAQAGQDDLSSGEMEYPASYGQQELWLTNRLAPLSPAYNLAGALQLTGPLDMFALERAFQRLVDRHPSLRTTFVMSGTELRQRISPSHRVFFQSVDVFTWNEERLRRELLKESQRAFDLESGPLLRVSVFRRSARDHVLLVVLHHIIGDLWSVAILLNELNICYQAEVERTLPDLPQLTSNYLDYVKWQTQLLSGAGGDQLWRYWQHELNKPWNELETATRQSLGKEYAAGFEQFSIDPELTSKLHAFARAQGVTPFMALLAIFQLLLGRYFGQKQFLLGTPASGRSKARFRDVCGYFVNPVVVRADLSGAITVQQHVQRVRETLLGAFEHQDFPYEVLVERFSHTRNEPKAPLFRVMFVLEKTATAGVAEFAAALPGVEIRIGTLASESIPLEKTATEFDLVMFVTESQQAFFCTFQYDRGVLGEEQVGRMARHYRKLVEEVIADPEQGIWEMPLLEEAERQQMVVDWNQTGEESGLGGNVVGMIEEQVARQPEELAVRDAREELSYRELNQRANQWAWRLRKKGVAAEKRVGICMERGVGMVVAQLGVLKAGGAYIPLDGEHPAERLRYQIVDSGAEVVIASGGNREKLEGLERVQVLWEEEERKWVEREENENPGWKIDGRQLAYVIYTSGSTGRPKGVEIEHGGLENLVQWHQRVYGIGCGDRGSLVAGVGFDASVWETWPYLAGGASLEIAGEEERVSAEKLRGWLVEKGVTTSFLATPLAEAVMRLGEWKAPELRRILTGGDRLQERPVESWEVEVVNHYGPTEYTVVATAGGVKARGKGRPVIGKPIGNTRVYVLDGEGEPVPVGVAGELYIGGKGLGRGYAGKAELTGERFVPDGLSGESGGRLYRTGDQCRWNEAGELEFMGRKDQQVKIRGYRIEVGEIEAVLKEHGGVEEAVVVVREAGSGVRQLMACYRGAAGREELKKHLRERVPGYMVPEVYVQVEEVPLNRSGKVDREALAKLQVEEPEGLEERGKGKGRAVEEIVQGIWAEVLGVERVGVEEDFFRLGGHSLLATQVMSRVREVFGVEVELRRLFENPTVRGLAGEIEQTREKKRREGGGGAGVELKLERRKGTEETAPLSYAQQRLWFLEQLRPGTPLYHIPVAVRLRGNLEVEALEASVNEIVRRHEVLRTGFEIVDGRPVQHVHPFSHVPLPVTDVHDLEQQLLADEIDEHIQKEVRTLFRLSAPPLLRLRLWRFAPDDHLLLLTMHHIISDGWSMGLFIKELASLYAAFSRQEQSPLHDLALQYADYSAWQHESSESGIWQHQMGYWKKQLVAPLPVLEMPLAHSRPELSGFYGRRLEFDWPSDFLKELNSFSNRNGVTLFMTLLAGFNALLHRYTGQTDIIVGTVIANRNHCATEQMIGFFINLLALRTRVEGNPAFGALLSHTRETTLDAYACQDVPFERIVEEVQPIRDLSRSPIFQVLFVLQNAPVPPLELPGLTIENVGVRHDVSKFDLSLYFHEEQYGLHGSLEFNPDLYSASTMDRMIVHLQSLLAAAIQDPSVPVSDIQFVASGEQEIVELTPTPSTPACQTTETLAQHEAPDEQLFAPPVTATQKTIAEIWSCVLEMEEISIHQKFFEIGGDSLRLVQVFLRLNEIYPDQLSVAELFRHNTIVSLSAYLDAMTAKNADSQPVLQAYEL